MGFISGTAVSSSLISTVFSTALISTTQYFRSYSALQPSSPEEKEAVWPSGKRRSIGLMIRPNPGSSLYVITVLPFLAAPFPHTVLLSLNFSTHSRYVQSISTERGCAPCGYLPNQLRGEERPDSLSWLSVGTRLFKLSQL